MFIVGRIHPHTASNIVYTYDYTIHTLATQHTLHEQQHPVGELNASHDLPRGLRRAIRPDTLRNITNKGVCVGIMGVKGLWKYGEEVRVMMKECNEMKQYNYRSKKKEWHSV